jgi:hypothetical protein
MGLFDWFRKKKPVTAWDALQQNPVFRQQREMFEAMSRLCEQEGLDVDELPNARGEFGLEPSNPIPCKTVFGSTAYLARLRTPDGVKVMYERTGSLHSDVSSWPIDAYAVSHPDGRKIATLYISPYQKRISSKAPRGFKLAGPTSSAASV